MAHRRRIAALILCILFAAAALPARAEEESFIERLKTVIEIIGASKREDSYHTDEYERLYFAVIDQTGGPGAPDFEAHSPAFRALFVVLIFDMEVQCGGVAQFFWNNGAEYAALLPDALRDAGFEDVADLYGQFISDNGMTLEEIDGYREQYPYPNVAGVYSVHPFDEFDEAYAAIWKETDFNKRLLDFASAHPEVYDDNVKPTGSDD